MIVAEMADEHAEHVVRGAELVAGREYSMLMIGAPCRVVGCALGENLSHLEDMLHQALVPLEHLGEHGMREQPGEWPHA